MFKILIAEDDRELRQLFQHVLTKNGYAAVGVSNGEEALAAMDTSYYDLIISDIMMPKLDGYELVRSLREAGNSIPVLMSVNTFSRLCLFYIKGTRNHNHAILTASYDAVCSRRLLLRCENQYPETDPMPEKASLSGRRIV